MRLTLPSVIEPFTLQLMVTPDLDIMVFDVAFRIGGSTNVYMGISSQYSRLYFGRPISPGRRITMGVRECVKDDCLDKVVT